MTITLWGELRTKGLQQVNAVGFLPLSVLIKACSEHVFKPAAGFLFHILQQLRPLNNDHMEGGRDASLLHE